MSYDNDLEMRHRNVCEIIANAAQEAGRAANATALCAVSKTFPADAIEPVIALGQKIFGENRVQEAEGKWPDLKAGHADIELHLIGPLQTNKTRNAVALFDVIQTLDRPKLAQSLAKEMEKADRRLPCYIQINTGEEPQKAGISPERSGCFRKGVSRRLSAGYRGADVYSAAKRRSIAAFRVAGGYRRPKRPDRQAWA